MAANMLGFSLLVAWQVSKVFGVSGRSLQTSLEEIVHCLYRAFPAMEWYVFPPVKLSLPNEGRLCQL